MLDELEYKVKKKMMSSMMMMVMKKKGTPRRNCIITLTMPLRTLNAFE